MTSRLSNGFFIRTQFNKADLRRVSFYGAELFGAELRDQHPRHQSRSELLSSPFTKAINEVLNILPDFRDLSEPHRSTATHRLSSELNREGDREIFLAPLPIPRIARGTPECSSG